MESVPCRFALVRGTAAQRSPSIRQDMPSRFHERGQFRARDEQVPDAIGGDQPFGSSCRGQTFATLTRGQHRDYLELVRAKVRAARFMVLNAASSMGT